MHDDTRMVKKTVQYRGQVIELTVPGWAKYMAFSPDGRFRIFPVKPRLEYVKGSVPPGGRPRKYWYGGRSDIWNGILAPSQQDKMRKIDGVYWQKTLRRLQDVSPA